MKYFISGVNNFLTIDDKPCKNAVWDEVVKLWFIVLNTLEEFNDLQNECGYPLIVTYDKNKGVGSIEIYNDYRE